MERFIDLHPLRRGSHPSRTAGMCAMEMVAWLAGEEHGDEPECACPVLAAFTRALNDALPNDAARDRCLRPLVPQLVNSRSPEQERDRALLAVDAAVRHFVPQLLERRARGPEAQLLRELPPLTDPAALRLAARALAIYAPEQHAARWVVQRALGEVLPARFVAGVVQIVRALGDTKAFGQAVELLCRMMTVGRDELPAGRAATTHPRESHGAGTAACEA
jgi:hypothetical protein